MFDRRLVFVLVLLLAGLAYAQLECSFVVDLSPPYLLSYSPAMGSVHDSAYICNTFNVVDDLAGVNTDSTRVVQYVYNDRLGTADTSVIVSATGYCQNYTNCDSVVLCVQSADLIPDLGCSCPPNHMEECFWFLVRMCEEGPVATSVFPPDSGLIISCPAQMVTFTVEDTTPACDGAFYDIVESEFIVNVTINHGGEIYNTDFTTADGGLTWDGVSSLTFDPTGAGITWSDGDTVTVTIVEAINSGGCDMRHTVSTTFIIDLTPPQVITMTPTCGSTISTSSITVNYSLSDLIAGVDPTTDSMMVRVEREGADVYNETRLHTGSYTIPFSLEDGDIVEMCIHTPADLVDTRFCPANVMADTCCLFYIGLGEPYAYVVMPIDSNLDGEVISACACQPIVMAIYDSHVLDTASVVFFVDADTMDLYDPRISIETFGDTLLHFTFTPDDDPCWADCQTIVFGLLEAEDEIGGTLADVVIDSFTVDLLPPVYTALTPADGDTVFEASFDLTATGIDSCTYALCGSSYTDIIVNGTDSTRYPGLNPTIGVFENGDVIRVCVSGCHDNPDYCDPNMMRDCRELYISLGEPYAWLIQPLDINGDGDTISACNCQSIVIGMYDSHGIDSTTIELEVEGVVYRWGDTEIEVDRVGDTMRVIFTPLGPAPCWAHGDVVEYELIAADNLLGSPLVETVPGWFLVDTEGPEFSGMSPAAGATISSETRNIRVSALDAICGAGGTIADSLVVSIDGIREIAFTDTLGGFVTGLENGDTVTVCAYAHDDCADYCPANLSEHCWDFYVELGAVSADLIEPIDQNGDDRVVSNCECQPLIWAIDHAYPLNDSTLLVTVDGVDYGYDSPEITLSGDTLTFTPAGPPCWGDGDSIPFSFVYIEDLTGAGMEMPSPGWVVIDLSGPELTGEYPADGSTIAEDSVRISLIGEDAICDDIVWDSLSIYNDGTYSETVEFVSETDLTGLTDGNTVRVCAYASDDCSDYCEPNQTEYCWEFGVAMGTVAGEVIEPVDGNGDTHIISNCECQPIVWEIEHEYPLILATLELTVDGISYTYADPEVTYNDVLSRIIFTPDGPLCWTDADTVYFSIDALDDSTGFGLGAPVTGHMVIDLSPPDFSGEYPTGTITDSDVTISVTAEDAVCDDAVYDSLVVTVGGTSTTYTGVLDADITGLSDGDVVHVCAFASDNCADYCDANSGDFCWDFDVAMGDPGATVRYPIDLNADGMVVSTCECQPIAWTLRHRYELDLTSIEVEVEGITYTLADPELTLSDDTDTLYFTPTGPAPCWTHADTVNFSLVALADSTGGTIGSPVSGWFIPDLEPPVFSGATPPDGGTVMSSSISTGVTATDEICGTAVFDSLVVNISGTLTTYPGVGTRLVTGLTDGDHVIVTAYASDDCADYCDPNQGSFTWEWDVAIGDLSGSVMRPVDVNGDSRWITACDDQDICILIDHTYGLDLTTLALDVDGTTYGIGDPEIEFTADSVIFTPPADWTHGDSIPFSLTALEDSTGGVLPGPVSGWFVVDLMPPDFSGEYPIGTVMSSSTDLGVTVTDEICADAVVDSLHVTGLGVDTTVYDTATLHLDDLEISIYYVTIWAHDDCHDYCGPNYSEFEWHFDVLLPCDLVVDAYPDTLVCIGSEVPLGVDATSTYRITEYEWQPAGLLDDNTIQNPTTTPLDVTTMFTVLVTDSNGCSVLDTVLVEVSPHIEFNMIYDQQLCAGIEYNPGLDGDMSISGGTEPYDIHWESSLGTTFDGEVNPTLSVEDTVDHTWTVTVIDAAGCGASWSFDIYVANIALGDFAVTYPACDDTNDAGDMTMVWTNAEFAEYYALFIDGTLVRDSMPDMDPMTFDTTFLCEETHDIQILAFRSCYYEIWDSVAGSMVVSGFSDAETTEVNCTFHTVTCGGPVGVIIVPEEGIYSACPDQHVLMEIEDVSGYDMDPTTMQVEIDGVTYDMSHEYMIWEAPYLWWVPDAGVLEEGNVTATLVDAANIMGIHIEEQVTVNFWVDLTPPEADFVDPGQGAVIFDTSPELSFQITDNLSGVDPSLLSLNINGETFLSSNLIFSDPWLNFNTQSHDMSFIPGDSVIVQLTACDSPTPPDSLYCEPNCDIFRWSFFVGAEYDCDAVPIPFTPGESSNNYVQFEYPGLALEQATIRIFNVRNVPVCEISAMTRDEARWYGRDDSGTDQKQGLYLYIIEVNGEIVCNGSIVLAR